MKIFVPIFFLIFSFYQQLFSQTIRHHHYTTHYNPLLRVPDSVTYDLTPEMINCKGAHIKRPGKKAFKQDPDIPGSAIPKDYAVNKRRAKAYQIDEGHLFSYEDASCDPVDAVECFYMTNILPQLSSFNKGDWRVLENLERKWAKTANLHIIAGGIGSVGRLPKGENIPAYFFKAIYRAGTWNCWIMPNHIASKGHKYTYWLVNKDELCLRSGLKL